MNKIICLIIYNIIVEIQRLSH